jgi:hypothetical protein
VAIVCTLTLSILLLIALARRSLPGLKETLDAGASAS